MATSFTPPFYFQANRLRQHANARDLLDTHGRWLPPRALGANVLRQGQSTDRIFYFNGNQTLEVPQLPQSAVHYRTISMYYCHGHFFILPYDCTQYQVASGVGDDVSSDEDEDAEGEEEEGNGPEFNSIDWSILRFRWIPTGYITEAWFDGLYDKLNTQRPDQRWVNKILPQTYRAEFARRTQDPLYGGLNGDLAILIGLLAFSAYDGAVADVFELSVRPVHTGRGWRLHNQHEEEGWVDRRGFVINIWSSPPFSTDEHLFALEQGLYGKIWQ